ncbi:MAG: S1C family serine protease [Planctomycetaceae bacterium]
MSRRLALLPLLLAGAAGAGDGEEFTRAARETVRRLERERVALAARLAPAVCAVFRGPGGGSGVIITADGLVLSNFHVTELAEEMRIGLNDQRIHAAAVIGVDPSGDLSLLRLKEKRTWPFAPLGDSDALRQGDWVYAMGNPFLLATDFTPTVTLGVVSGINRYQPGSIRGTLVYPDCIQTDASINPGNSGGPLFNFLGEVVGINGRVSLRDRGRVNIGVGYAISANQIRHCLPELRAGMIVEHGTLNATVSDVLDPAWPGGVRVTFQQILSPGCAANAGLLVGDALVSFQGQPIGEANQFLRLVSVLPKGRRVALEVASYKDASWTRRTLRLDLDGIPIVGDEVKARRPVPRVYVEDEIARTLAAARGALQPIGEETRRGTLTVRDRDPQPLLETYSGGGVEQTLGDKTRGGKPGAQNDDYATDLLERAAAWNDLVHADGALRFESLQFTGGSLVDGRTVDRLEAKSADGKERVYFVHLDTGRLWRIDLYSQAWLRPVSFFLSDWREAGGLLRPYRVEIWDRDKESLLQTIAYESVQAK